MAPRKKQSDGYGLQSYEASARRIPSETGGLPASQVLAALLAGTDVAPSRSPKTLKAADERLREEVESVADALGRDHRAFTQRVSSVSWGLDPWGTGKPMVTLVTFRPCLTMSVEDAVLRGLLSSSGFNEMAYEREMKVFTGAASAQGDTHRQSNTVQ